jgi:small neutral amino acid transporter SnatA (MarC family)
MNGWALALLAAAATGPAVAVLRLSGAPAGQVQRGAVAAAAVGIVAAVIATPLLDALSIEPESFWIGAGLVLAATGLFRVVVSVGGWEPVTEGPWSWLYPIAYPVLLGPDMVLALMAAGSHEDALWGIAGVVVALGLVVGGFDRGPPLLWRGAARLTAAVQVVLAIALVIDGIRAV